MILFERVKNIILNPSKEWETIKLETWTNAELFTKYAIILAAIPAVCGFIGYSLFGISWGFGSFHVPVGISLSWAIATYVLTLVGVFIVAFIIDALAPSFGSVKDMNASLKVTVFSYTPAWVAGIFNLVPALGIIAALAGIYSLVLFYMGLERVKNVPKDKMMGYFIVTLIVAIVVYFIIGLIVSAIAFSGLYTRTIL